MCISRLAHDLRDPVTLRNNAPFFPRSLATLRLALQRAGLLTMVTSKGRVTGSWTRHRRSFLSKPGSFDVDSVILFSPGFLKPKLIDVSISQIAWWSSSRSETQYDIPSQDIHGQCELPFICELTTSFRQAGNRQSCRSVKAMRKSDLHDSGISLNIYGAFITTALSWLRKVLDGF